jgi:hypothetical protein
VVWIFAIGLIIYIFTRAMKHRYSYKMLGRTLYTAGFGFLNNERDVVTLRRIIDSFADRWETLSEAERMEIWSLVHQLAFQRARLMFAERAEEGVQDTVNLIHGGVKLVTPEEQLAWEQKLEASRKHTQNVRRYGQSMLMRIQTITDNIDARMDTREGPSDRMSLVPPEVSAKLWSFLDDVKGFFNIHKESQEEKNYADL